MFDGVRTSLGAADAPIARELRLRRGEIALLLSDAALIKIACSRGMAVFLRAIVVDSDFGHEFSTGQGRMARFFGEQVPLLAI